MCGAEPRIDAGGKDDATNGGKDRQRCQLERGKFSNQHFVLDFKAHQQEEDRHQAVIDPVTQILRQIKMVEANRDGNVEQARVKIRRRRIHPDHSDHRAGQQNNAARAFNLRKARK